LPTREQKAFQKWMDGKARRETGAKQTKKADKSGNVRPKRWTDAYLVDPDGYDDLDLEGVQRVMPKGETEWRQAKIIRSPLHEGIGVTEAQEDAGHAAGVRPHQAAVEQARGTVIEVAAGLYTVKAEAGRYVCTLRKSLRDEHSGYGNMLAVGDEVMISHNGHERAVVDAILPRRSALARPDPFNKFKQQVIVANTDQLLIVASWRNPAFWPELVDRYLIAALRHNLTPVLVINKVDIAEDRWELDAIVEAYHAAGFRVILTSAVEGQGLDELRAVLRGKTTALAGLSGVGKSSLLSAAEPGLNLRVGDISDRRHEGRHTTTQVTLHALADGGFVADTPGIREFGLAGLKKSDLALYYPEFAEPGSRCEYANCSHTREPWCAVKSAMRAGRLSRMRLESYWKILQELE
jgi:ribosome biogenesis GTPase